MSSYKLTNFLPQKISFNKLLPDLTAGMVAGTFVVIVVAAENRLALADG
jgi:hypothetical protein